MGGRAIGVLTPTAHSAGLFTIFQIYFIAAAPGAQMSVVQPVCRPRDVEETAGAGRRAPRRAARTRTRRVPRPRVAVGSGPVWLVIEIDRLDGFYHLWLVRAQHSAAAAAA